jgi:undecaprenyl-diphosphatase
LELSFFENLILGLISGFAEVLPVSAQAHRIVILKMLGMNGDSTVLRFMIHLASAGALYFYCKGHIVRMMRARRLARVPKNRRKRPLDTEALMDFSLLKFALIPVILGFLAYSKLGFLSRKLIWVAGLLLVNGIILYVPQYLPGSNKQSGSLSRVDSLYFGLGGVLGMLPGVSAVGSAVSIGTVRGMDPQKALDFALLLNIPVNLGFALFDLLELVGGGAGSLAFRSLLFAAFAGAAAFAGIILGINLMKKISLSIGNGVFGFYCWGAALLTFLLYLAAA